ncbi:hypothetical protein [Streptomyces tubercidicus]|uniref:Uncharacterized protein n=1 Tax=Streptomyces tubercidicus TaxID=47759 RepID=A0A640V295_9ACTN|nr:hypothetical protein [Streptomyces tubercidicus]WAU15814.1 hypothetical protein STRTU_006561 [Streptomyces tubercidicus]GFE41702.1 hypothetical protein Stube_63750 [Streptomyces tubercidicus]
MHRRISALAVTAAVAGGVLFAALPAQAATTAAGRQSVAAGGAVQVNIDELRQQSADLKAKAARLDNEGEHGAADRARAEARALDERIQAYLDAEENAS